MRTSVQPEVPMLSPLQSKQDKSEWISGPPAWKQLKIRSQNKTGRGKASSYQQQRARKIINYNYYVTCVASDELCTCDQHVSELECRGGQTEKLFVTGKRERVIFLPVNSCVVTHVPLLQDCRQRKMYILTLFIVQL